MGRTIGILTGGGDAPGLNAVIRAFVASAMSRGWTVVGVEDAYTGLLTSPRRLVNLDGRRPGLVALGGTILGTTNKADPFRWIPPDSPHAEPYDASDELVSSLQAEGIEGMVTIGGDGTQRIARRLMTERGVRFVGVPKTIDNDLHGTETTFGFQSAVDVATDAVDRLHTTAESHDRVMLLEVMGRDAGHIALAAGVAGGADVILIPEIPWDPQRVAAKIKARRRRGRHFSIVVVAEGALPIGGVEPPGPRRSARLRRGGGAASIAAANLEGRIEADMRLCVLGHLQRGGSPVPFDRLLATRFGVTAAELVAANRWGEMVRLRHGKVEGVSMERLPKEPRLVDVGGELAHVARTMGIELGG